jgi:hypothetical protein
MHIAAFMAALRVTDVGPLAKHALQVFCGRADRYTAMARVSIGQMAVDMGRNYKTAQRALGELVDAGYLTVDKSAGRSHLWMLTGRLTSVPGTEVPRTSVPTTSVPGTEDLGHLCRGEGVFREKQGAASRRPRQAAGDAAGENLPAAGPALRLVNGQTCRRCLGTGWAVGPGGQSYQCHHREQL